ncbi:helix-turn-helix domain-containing protein [Ottowia pentelensis]
MRGQSVSEAADALGLTRRTVYRLRDGYWPRNASNILSAWRACQGELADRASRWVMRRVYPGGMVLHARRWWTADGLAGRTDQSLALARTSEGQLLAQTLELPPERLLLREVA